MQELASLLDRPEYIHATINHFPLIGLLVAMLVVLLSLFTHLRLGTVLGLALLAVMALSAWPVSYFGEAGYDRVLSMADDPGQAYLKYHAHLADRWVYVYYITAAVAILGIALNWKWPQTLLPLSILVLVLAGASLTAGIFIAHAGGEIRHREFRTGPPPAVPADEH
jgi:hypothetical protein